MEKVTIPALARMKRETETYANVAQTSLDAFTAQIAGMRAGRQIKG